MGVVSFDKNNSVVWGASSRFIYDIIAHGIELVGSRKYFLSFKDQFDQGYNHIELHKLPESELQEFRNIVVQYKIGKSYYKFGTGHEEMARSLDEFVVLIDKMMAASGNTKD